MINKGRIDKSPNSRWYFPHWALLLLSCLVRTNSSLKKGKWGKSMVVIAHEDGNTGTCFCLFVFFWSLSNWRFKSNLHCVVHEHGNSHGSNTTRHWGQMAGNFHHLKTSHCVFVSICVFIWLLPPTHCDGHDWTGHLIVVHVSHEPLTRLFCRVRDGVDSWRSGLDTKQTERWKKRKELVFAALFAFN